MIDVSISIVSAIVFFFVMMKMILILEYNKKFSTRRSKGFCPVKELILVNKTQNF